jgi:hypothetical protein
MRQLVEMNPHSRKPLRLLGIAALVGIVGLFFAYRTWERQQMLRQALAWARLAPLPASSQGFTIAKEGSMFTRAFRISFTAPVADVERWLNDSPGPRENTPEQTSATARRFLISPGGGAQHAEVTIENSGAVRIDVYWS